MSLTGSDRFHVTFNFDRLGGTEGRILHIPDYCFDKIDGNGMLTELLNLPEFEEFIREEVE